MASTTATAAPAYSTSPAPADPTAPCSTNSPAARSVRATRVISSRALLPATTGLLRGVHRPLVKGPIGRLPGTVLMLLPAAIFVMAIDVAIPAGVDVGVGTRGAIAASRSSRHGSLGWFGPGRSGSKTPLATTGNTGARVVQSHIAVPMHIAARICPRCPRSDPGRVSPAAVDVQAGNAAPTAPAPSGPPAGPTPAPTQRTPPRPPERIPKSDTEIQTPSAPGRPTESGAAAISVRPSEPVAADVRRVVPARAVHHEIIRIDHSPVVARGIAGVDYLGRGIVYLDIS